MRILLLLLCCLLLSCSQTTSTEPPPDGEVIAEFQRKAWWPPEYQRLNDSIDKADSREVNFSYRTGPGGVATVTVTLRRADNGGLIVSTVIPPEALKHRSPDNGRLEAGSDGTTMILRDHDLDGWPDDVKLDPAGEPVFAEEFTDDGFMKIRDSDDHTGVLVAWTLTIGFATNYLLHNGKESAFP